MPPTDELRIRVFENPNCSEFNFLKCNTTSTSSKREREREGGGRLLAALSLCQVSFVTTREQQRHKNYRPRGKPAASSLAHASRLPGKFLIKFRAGRALPAGRFPRLAAARRCETTIYIIIANNSRHFGLTETSRRGKPAPARERAARPPGEPRHLPRFLRVRSRNRPRSPPPPPRPLSRSFVRSFV